MDVKSEGEIDIFCTDRVGSWSGSVASLGFGLPGVGGQLITPMMDSSHTAGRATLQMVGLVIAPSLWDYGEGPPNNRTCTLYAGVSSSIPGTAYHKDSRQNEKYPLGCF